MSTENLTLTDLIINFEFNIFLEYNKCYKLIILI